MSTDFSSLDKLMEFGLGMGIATQMMNTMNTTLARTAMPGVGLNPGVTPECVCAPAAPAPQNNAPAPEISKGYYIVIDEKLAGPLTAEEIGNLVSKKIVTKRTFCWYPGLDAWKFAEDIPEVNKMILLNG